MKIYSYLFVTLCFFITYQVVYAQSNRGQEPQQHTHNGQNHARNYKQNPNYPTVQKDEHIGPDKSDERAEDARKQSKENMMINHSIMRATWVIAIAAMLQVCAVVAQGIIMLLQIKHLRKTVEASERAASASENSVNALRVQQKEIAVAKLYNTFVPEMTLMRQYEGHIDENPSVPI